MKFNEVYICPTDKTLQCSWQGNSEDILKHFIMEHEDLLCHSSEIDIDLNLTNENRLLFLDEEIYLIQLKMQENSLQIGLRYLGPVRIANCISYDIIVKVEDQYYMYNHFGNVSSMLCIVNGFWTVDLNLLKEQHQDLSRIQCNFNISKNITEIDSFDGEYIFDTKPQIEDEDVEEESSNPDTVIELDEIQDILEEHLVRKISEENIELRNKSSEPEERDALDNMSNLDFNILENSRYCRRYSSFTGIPFGLFEEKELIDLTCSNCNINMLPPIYLCVNNHNICADCKSELCKICSEHVTENRNKELEEHSRQCLHSCRYYPTGCMESFKYNEIRNHEIKCKFCTYNCVELCSFQGKFFEFLSHFKLNHSSMELMYSTPVDFPKNKEFCVCDNDLGMFFCMSTLVDNTVKWTVKYLGPKDRNFSCELKFKRTKLNNELFFKRVEDQYCLALTKDDLKKMKVKDKNAILTISGYFN
ncbi:hypothetical protein WA026_003814 [Henosepilachna vigintioctopunctata]|uniref:SIAH-type domain-containing protein n=1 Tax=Henosepilachna vigintioctopunctata TaxID=420089 RepID=A0AAW1U5M7_9CUCU